MKQWTVALEKKQKMNVAGWLKRGTERDGFTWWHTLWRTPSAVRGKKRRQLKAGITGWNFTIKERFKDKETLTPPFYTFDMNDKCDVCAKDFGHKINPQSCFYLLTRPSVSQYESIISFHSFIHQLTQFNSKNQKCLQQCLCDKSETKTWNGTYGLSHFLLFLSVLHLHLRLGYTPSGHLLQTTRSEFKAVQPESNRIEWIVCHHHPWWVALPRYQRWLKW